MVLNLIFLDSCFGYVVSNQDYKFHRLLMNALEQQLYPVEEFQLDTTRDVPYKKGMSITLNNHKCSQYYLYTKLKDIYGSIYKALTGGSKISKDDILTSRWKVPNRNTIMDMVIRDQPIMVAGIHKYNDIKHFDEYHLHMYVYGVHTYLQHEDGSIRFQKLGSYLKRYLNSRRKRTPSAVDIREVGINNNKSNDVITPATVYDYLKMPQTNPEKNSWINYLAETRRDTSYTTPYYYLYQKF